LAKKGVDPMQVARRMLDGYQRALLIDTGVGDRRSLRARAQEIADRFNWRVETVDGSLSRIEDALRKALAMDRP
jgi:hypothetical protein